VHSFDAFTAAGENWFIEILGIEVLLNSALPQKISGPSITEFSYKPNHIYLLY